MNVFIIINELMFLYVFMALWQYKITYGHLYYY